jgi:lipoprotein-releasing system ATP-binding protein
VSVAVRAAGLTKTYQDGVRRVEVLRGVDLTVEPGEMVAIVGPSGSGKSTLLHLLGALDRPDAGTVEIGGQLLAGLSGASLAAFRNRTIGFVFQFHQLLPDFTALENVMLPGRIARLEPKAVHENACRLLSEVGLENRLDHFPNQLSGGERQRVALCRALVLEPPLLLADEPTGNLDPESGATVFQLLLDLQARHNTTGILVTHNPEIAQRCSRIQRLEGGALHQGNADDRSQWEGYLRGLPLPEGPLTAERAEQIRALWAVLERRVGPLLRPPSAGPLENGGFAMSWDNGRHHFEIEVSPSSTYSWFYMDRDSDLRSGEEDQSLGTVSPGMISDLHRTVAA